MTETRTAACFPYAMVFSSDSTRGCWPSKRGLEALHDVMRLSRVMIEELYENSFSQPLLHH
jgi:hypothetical protein